MADKKSPRHHECQVGMWVLHATTTFRDETPLTSVEAHWMRDEPAVHHTLVLDYYGHRQEEVLATVWAVMRLFDGWSAYMPTDAVDFLHDQGELWLRDVPHEEFVWHGDMVMRDD